MVDLNRKLLFSLNKTLAEWDFRVLYKRICMLLYVCRRICFVGFVVIIPVISNAPVKIHKKMSQGLINEYWN